MRAPGFAIESSPVNLGECILGGAKRARTADLRNAIAALYQLSYGPKKAFLIVT